MDDISSIIGQLLKDPEQIQNIMQAAKNFLPQESADDVKLPDQERIMEIGKLLQTGQYLRSALFKSQQSYMDVP